MRIEWRTDNPPEEREIYLVTYEDGSLDICQWTNVNMFWTNLVTNWHWQPAPYCKVVAWMPLPHAYIAKEEEENETNRP